MFGVTPQYVLHDISYVNVMMYSSAIPMVGDTETEKEKKERDFNEALDANNPDNFSYITEEETVRV